MNSKRASCSRMNETDHCHPCKLRSKSVCASKYCDECEELLCEECVTSHAKRKATSVHQPVPIGEEKSVSSCSPCKDDGTTAVAITYCDECEENLCIDCTLSHGKRKATRAHKLIVIKDMNDKHLGKDETIPLCKPCVLNEKETRSIKYCNDCDEYLCESCTNSHMKRKATQTHNPVPVSMLKKGEKKTDLQNRSMLVVSSDLTSKNKGAKIKGVDICKGCNESKFIIKCGTDCQHNMCEKCCEVHRLLDHDKIEDTNRQDGGTSDKRVENVTESTKKDCPGKPRSSDVQTDTITLTWDRPSKFGDDDYYQVSYKEIDHGRKWKFYQSEFKSSTAVLQDLKSNTAFIFRVRVVYEDGEGSYSKESDEISTYPSQASRFVKASVLKEEGSPSPSKYALPITEIRQARNEKAKTKKFELGEPPLQRNKSKTIMLVGATGTGKSTLVDGMVNYVLCTNWDAPFRFTVLDLEQEEKDRVENQALSQTEWITCYTLNPGVGSRLKYQLNIIDTPGFGDTRGLKRDEEIIQQIRQLFSEKEPKGVTFIDAVCFLIKAPDARLTAVQSYIFQSIMSLFGNDIENNICSLVTFADGNDPPVLAALKQSGLPFGKSFTFNNSGLFAKNSDIDSSSLSPMFWNMGLTSFRAFFAHLEQMDTKSLQLTKEVLNERTRLEATIKNLQPHLDAWLIKVNSLKNEIQIIEQNKTLIKDNRNFEYEVDETRHKKKELPRGQHVTNCTNCHFTCHDNCVFAHDNEKAKCSAMGSDGKCTICPKKCRWTKHSNTPYIFEYVIVKVKKTYKEMQQKYKDATGKVLSKEQIVKRLGKELDRLLSDIEAMMVVIKKCNERLKEIALRPNPLSLTEYIDLLIQNEELEKKEGFIQRINILKDCRRKALISKHAESFSTEARSSLGAVGDKLDQDTLALLDRAMTWNS